MANRWAHEPQYSHGYLVPVFALFLLWHRREEYAAVPFRGSPWGVALGLALVLAGVLLRLAGSYFYYSWLEAVSLLPCLDEAGRGRDEDEALDEAGRGEAVWTRRSPSSTACL
jgi:hypothetical protein